MKRINIWFNFLKMDEEPIREKSCMKFWDRISSLLLEVIFFPTKKEYIYNGEASGSKVILHRRRIENGSIDEG
jgi:hypothetical protein